MIKESCLILGAGLMQKPAILSAKQLGLKTFVIDANPKSICVSLADEFMQIDLKAKEEILEYAKYLKEKENLISVFTAGTDFSSSVSYVCQNLNLASHTYQAAINASIKTQMRQCFLENNIPSPKFISINKEQSKKDTILKDVLKIMEYPFVVKPVDNMGARGCRMVRSKDEFLNAIDIALNSSKTNTAIVEEYMEGPEYSIDALVYNNTMTITGFAERHIKYPPYFIEVGHTMPAILSEDQKLQLISVFALGTKALGLTCGAAKADIKFTKKGPMIGEIAGRLSGGYMSGWTYPYSSDLNLTKEALLISCNKEPKELIKKRKPLEYLPSELCKDLPKPYDLFEVESVRTSAERAWISIPGTVKYIENITEYTDKAVFDVLPRATVNISSDVCFPRNNVEKCGNVISVSNQREIAINASTNFVSNILITLEPKNKKTEDFINCKTYDYETNFPPSAFGILTKEELEQIPEFIEKDESVIKTIPKFLLNADYINRQDWNYNTIEETIKKFDLIRPRHPRLNAKDFWKALMRGGLQAAVYVSDTIEYEQKK